MIKILKKLVQLILWSLNKLNNFKKVYLNFIFPNLFFLFTKRLDYKIKPVCHQKFFLTGVGKIRIGKGCVFGYELGGFHRGGAVELQARYKDAKIIIGENVATNNNVFICAANYIEIKESTRIGQSVTIMDFEAHGIEADKRNKIGEIGSVTVGENVWIGNNVIILKNSSIGENSIVAAGAVVTGIFPGNVIIGGVPAKIIKKL